MHLSTQLTPTPQALSLDVTALRRSSLLSALVAVVLVMGLLGGGAPAAASDRSAADLRVGHRVERIVVPGAAQGEPRQVDVHLWYPADVQDFAARPKAVYRSALYGQTLIPGRWDPLSWSVAAEIATEDASIDPHGAPFPVIVFSHGSVNDPIDYAYTLELIAGAGFVVAAPSHVNNTQDDVRIDFINGRAGRELFACRDGRPGPCSRTSVPFSMADRVRDISAVLDMLPAWLGDRVDVERVGVMGHSRGTVSALAAAGGSALLVPDNPVCQRSGDLCWPLAREPRIDAVMGMATAVLAITRGADLANIRVPTLLIAGTADGTSPQAISEFAFGEIPRSTEKAFVSIAGATHRSFDSTYCAQLQAAGAFAQASSDAILDRHTFDGIALHPSSGIATQYCGFDAFTHPVDIRPLVLSFTGFRVTADNVPSMGLETDEVKHGMTELAVAFFGTVLKRTGEDGLHFTRYLAPKWLEKHEPMAGDAAASGTADAVCPLGLDVDCGD